MINNGLNWAQYQDKKNEHYNLEFEKLERNSKKASFNKI